MSTAAASEADAPPEDLLGDVSNSAALQLLETLVSKGTLARVRADYFRSKYEKVHEMVLRSYDRESQLVAKGRSSKQELDALEEKLKRYESNGKEDDGVIESLKGDKAKADLELAECQEREAALSIDRTELERQLEGIQSEIAEEEQRKIEQLKPIKDQLEYGIGELKRELERLHEQDAKYEEQRSNGEFRLKQLRHELDNLKEDLEREQEQVKRVEADPEKMRKQVSIAARANDTMEKDLNRLEEMWKSMESESNLQAVRKSRIEKDWYELSIGLESQRTAVEQKQKLVDELEKNIEKQKEIRGDLLANKMDIELRDNGLEGDYHREADVLNRLTKDKDHLLKQVRKLENSIGNLKQQHTDVATQSDLAQRTIVRLQEQRQKNQQSIEELKRDIDIGISSFLTQEGVEKEAVEQYMGIKKHVKAMEDDIQSLVTDMKELNNDVTRATAAREKSSRDCTKSKNRYKEALDLLKMKQGAIGDLQRQEDELQQRIAFVEDLYGKLKTERNKYATLIQTSMQKLAEIKEKNSILENELEVLQRKTAAKESVLAKERRDQAEKFANRETLRNEANKLLMNYKQRKVVLDEQLSTIERLHSLIENAEEGMLRLKQSYERAVADRNFAGLALIDRNDELCILYEKANIQDSIYKDGEMALRQKEEEANHLRRELYDLQRSLTNCLNAEPEFHRLRVEAIEYQNQLMLERSLAEYLSEALDSPANTARWRPLGGHDDPPEKLQAKMGQLEERVHSVKEMLLEKQLIADEIGAAAEKLRADAAHARGPALAVAQQLNAYQSALRDKTKKMMALVAELSMVQALAMKLQLERDEKKSLMEEAERRMAMGEPPTDDAEDAFFFDVKEKLRQQEILLNRKQRLEAEQVMPATITRTTAEPRPNAYIPDDEMGIPKPYGVNAPFKPVDMNLAVVGGMRHIRKPKPQEIIL